MKAILAVAAGALAISGCVIIESDEIAREIEREVIVEVEKETPTDVNPLDLRRTTLVVRDIEKSLALYRDALGMTVEYDEELTSPGLSMRYGADGQNRSRLVLLKANDSFIGMLGLWQFLDQTDQDLAEPDPADFTPVCTTEIGRLALKYDQLEAMDCLVATLSVDPVKSHEEWLTDVVAHCENKIEVKFPRIGDADRAISTAYGMLDLGTSADQDLPLTIRAVFIINPENKLMLALNYPAVRATIR